MDRIAKLSLLAAMVQRMSDDEIDVMLEVARGAEAGHEQYGPLSIERDPRDFTVETAQEVRDGLFYVGAELVRLKRLLPGCGK